MDKDVLVIASQTNLRTSPLPHEGSPPARLTGGGSPSRVCKPVDFASFRSVGLQTGFVRIQDRVSCPPDRFFSLQSSSSPVSSGGLVWSSTGLAAGRGGELPGRRYTLSPSFTRWMLTHLRMHVSTAKFCKRLSEVAAPLMGSFFVVGGVLFFLCSHPLL